MSAKREYQLVGADHGRTHAFTDITQAQSQLSRVRSDTLCGRYESNYFASVLVLGLRSAPFYGITHIVEYKDRDGRHAMPLFGTKRFVQWLPRLGESIQIG